MRAKLGFILTIAALLVLHLTASADIYVLPPQPVPVVLRTGEQAIAVNVDANAAFTPDRAAIVLGVAGTPVYEPPPKADGPYLVKPGVEDAPLPVLHAQGAVRQSDLDVVRNLLVRGGVPAGAISTSFALAADQKLPIGKVTVEVDPATGGQYDAIATKIARAIADYSNIAQTSSIFAMNTCADKQLLLATAARQAEADAEIAGAAAGFAAGAVRRNDERIDTDAPQFQVLCGGEREAPPQYDFGRPSQGAFVGYRLDVAGGLVFSLKPAKPPSASQMTLQEASTAAPAPLISHAFIVPDNEPFVSAQGSYSARVAADAGVDSVSVPGASGQTIPPRVRNLIEKTVMAAVPAGHVLSTGAAWYVRIQSDAEELRLKDQVAAVGSKDAPFAPYVAQFRFVENCAGVKRAVAAEAYARALERARIMASQAHVRMGPLIAIDDAGSRTGAICGFGARTPLRDLVRAIELQPPGPIAQYDGTVARTFAIAWRLNVAPHRRAGSVPDFAPPYAFSTINQAFITHGAGRLGAANTLQDATLNGLAPSHGALQALIDQGGAFPDDRERQQRVLVVTGP